VHASSPCVIDCRCFDGARPALFLFTTRKAAADVAAQCSCAGVRTNPRPILHKVRIIIGQFCNVKKESVQH